MTGPLREVDDEFADFVRARQHQLVRAAYLLLGDEQEAERLVRGAFTTLSLSWRTVRDEDLDAFVRRTLYRAGVPRRARGDGTGPEGKSSPVAEVVSALAELSGRQRAVVVLLHFERRNGRDTGAALGMTVGTVAAQDSSARRRLHELVPHLVGEPGSRFATTQLASLLDAACSHIEARDLVEDARQDARLQRGRRRRIRVGALGAVAALVVGVVLLPRGDETGDPPTVARTSPAATGAAEWDPSEIDVRGVPAQVGPTARQLVDLPRLPDLTRKQLALPEVLAFGPDTRIPELSEVGANGAPVRAVLLRHTADGMRAVLLRPTLTNPYVLVDTVPLVSTLDEGGNLEEPLEVKAIADDRRHVMFVQPGKVVVLDAFTGEVRTYAVPDRHLEDGGWVGSEVIVWSGTYRWRISPDTGRVARLGPAAHPGRFRVAVAGSDELRIHGFDARGTGSASRSGPSVLSAVWGASFTNDDDRVATGGALSESAALEANRQRPMRLFQGVFTIDAGTLSASRLLLAPGSEGVAVGCCEVLGWAYQDEVLVRWNGTDLLMWNARTGTLLRVSTLPGRQEATPIIGSAATSVAIAP